MKKFTKLFLSCALVSAMAVTAAASAFAAVPAEGYAPITGDVTGKAKIDATTNTVTITDLALPTGTTVAANTEVTFLVFQGTQDVSTDASNVEGIDQNTYVDTVNPTNNGLKSAKWEDEPESTEAVTYTVMVGYTDNADQKFKTAKGTFMLTEVAGETYIIGNVNDDSKVDSKDANKILYYDAEMYTYDECAYAGRDLTISDAGANAATLDKTKLVGDVNNDGKVDSKDANKVLYYDAEMYTYDECANAGAEVTATYDKATE